MSNIRLLPVAFSDVEDRKLEVEGDADKVGVKTQELFGEDSKPSPPPAPSPSTEVITEGQECIICLDAKKTVVMIPCKHKCLCSSCSKTNDIKECPICRVEVLHALDLLEVYD